MRISVLFVAGALALGMSGHSQAAELRIGVATENVSLYPNWQISTPNQQIASHIFEPLIAMDADSQLQPALAVSWSSVDELTWEFKLRQGVTFHDGTPFNADNVVSTFDHTLTIAGVGSSSASYLKGKKYEKINDHTIRIRTEKPSPLLPNEMTVVYIYARPENVDNFNAGTAVVGTGPYKLREWVRGDHLSLDRNDGYWGTLPEWDSVTFRPITSDASRLAALLSGQVDLIDSVPRTDIQALQKNDGVTLFSRPGERIMMLQLDVSRSVSPYVADKSGKPMMPNPFRDWRVRKAISMAINREGLVERLMDGEAVVAGQIAAPGMFGHDDGIPVDAYDPEGARKLMAEAGYAEGFKVTLHGPNDRYVNDARTLEAIAPMLNRIGIESTVETMPVSIYSPTRSSGGEFGTPKYSISYYGFGTATGETMSQHWMLLHTPNKERGLGHANVGGYSNVDFDLQLDAAMTTLDSDKRLGMIRQIGRLAMQDIALVPLFWQNNVWGARKGIVYEPRLMEVTHAMGARSR